jgi:membrane protein
MASLADVPLVLRKIGPFTLLKRIFREVKEDNLPSWGAALAYSWLIALFPFLIFLLSLVPYLPGKFIEEARVHIEEFLYTWLSEYSAWTIWENVKGVLDKPRGALLSVGILFTLWAAAGGVNMTMTALDRCYEIERGRSFFKRRAFAVFITIITASMIIAVLVLIPIGTVATKWTINYWNQNKWPLPGWIIWMWNIARYTLALILMFSVVAIMYYFGISVRQKWRLFSPGSVFTICVWVALGVGFRWYVNTIGKENYSRTYGTVGGVAVLLLFFYLDALVLMIGAEINSEIDYEVLGVPRGTRDFVTKPQPMFTDMSQPHAVGVVQAKVPSDPITDVDASHETTPDGQTAHAGPSDQGAVAGSTGQAGTERRPD